MNLSDAYRVEALLELAAAYPAARTTAEIARRRGIPEKFLARLLGELARQGTVTTARGPHGGVRLGRPPAELPLAAVVAAGTPLVRGGAAVVWLQRRLTATRTEVLARVTLADLLRLEQEGDYAPTWEI